MTTGIGRHTGNGGTTETYRLGGDAIYRLAVHQMGYNYLRKYLPHRYNKQGGDIISLR